MIDVEPLIVPELDRMLPLPDGGRADWSDVLSRSGLPAQGAGRRWRPLLVAAVAVAALVGAGVAIAAGFGAFNGIGAAQHPQTAADIPPAVAALIAQTNKQLVQAESKFHYGLGQLDPSSARFLTRLSDEARIWVVATTTDQLCTLAEGIPGGSSNPNGVGALGCVAPLTNRQPTTVGQVRPDYSLPPLSWGVTLDSVAAVSFMAGGREVTVPVKNNVWSYEGANSALQSLTVHFTDGNTQTIR